MRLLSRREPRLAPITESLAYARCHGDRSPDLIRVMRIEPSSPPPPPSPSPQAVPEVTGESLRRAFEEKLEHRRA